MHTYVFIEDKINIIYRKWWHGALIVFDFHYSHKNDPVLQNNEFLFWCDIYYNTDAEKYKE